MAAFRAVGTVVSGESTTREVKSPGTTAVGDYLICEAMIGNGTLTPAMAGWEELASGSSTAGESEKTVWFGKYATEAGEKAFTVTWGGTKTYNACQITAIKEPHATEAVHKKAGKSNTTSSKSVKIPSVKIEKAGCVSYISVGINQTGTGKEPANWTERQDNTVGCYVATRDGVPEGETGELTIELSESRITATAHIVIAPTAGGKTVELKASITSTSAVAAKLTLTRLFAASISSASSVTAKLSLTRLFKATISSASELKASLLRTRLFKASVASTSSITAALEVKAKAATAFRPQRKPPLELDWEAETAEGTIFRFPADTWKAANRFTGSSGSTQRGDGFATGGLILNREIFKDYPDIGLMDTWRMVGRNGEIAYEGRMLSAPRTNDPQQQIQISLVGWMTYLKGRSISALIIDRRLSGWQEASLQRRANLLAAGYVLSGNASAAFQFAGEAAAGLYFDFSGATKATAKLGTELWFYAGGEDIGALKFDFVGDGTTPWDEFPGISSDDLFTSRDFHANLNGASASGQEVTASTSGRKFAMAQAFYTGVYTGQMTNAHSYRNPRVVGTHELTVRGASPEEGYYLSDVIEFILSFYPKIEWAGETNTFVLPQATWHDAPATGYDAIQQLNNFALWETNVWEERKFNFEQADLTKADWQLKTTDPGVKVNFQGDSIENFANGVPVVYTDFGGVTHTLWPPDHPELRDESEDNPANRHGEYLWTAPVTVPWPCLEGEALQFGRAYLGEYNRPKRPGSFTVEGGYIKDIAGHWQQYWKVRNSETLMVANHPSETDVRLITASSWDSESLNLTITVDAPSSVLDAVVARQELALQARNLSG